MRLRFEVFTSEYHTPDGVLVHIMVRRRDGKGGITWDELQRIKNEVAGPEEFAVEVYPPESELVDERNMRHLFVMPYDWIGISLKR